MRSPYLIIGKNELDEKPIFQQIDHDGAYGVKGLFPASKMSEKDHKILKAAYWAMVDLIDKQVGRIMNVLEETGQLENTGKYHHHFYVRSWRNARGSWNLFKRSTLL